MLKEYRVRYALKSAQGNTVVHAIVVKTLNEVTKTKSRIRKAGCGFLGTDWRERNTYTSLLDGWKSF